MTGNRNTWACSMAEGVIREPEADCPVCWNPYNNNFRTPKLLDCGHCFCLECLARLSLLSQPNSRLSCPLCRRPTVLQPEQPITDLPTNSAVLAQLRLEPNQIMLEGRQLCFKDSRKSRFFTRQPTVYTLTLGMEQGRQSGAPSNQVQPRPATVSSHNSLRQCFRNPQFRIFLYLMATMLSVTLLLIVSIFWTRRFLWGVG